ncbi:MAG: Uma2 family endonuclease [Aphanocapsa lilacina HA4352-LM1]|jgi:Uma2 family endonuclease|nr:Uma2 family endonuclease [Aphanocapsa lilacina HA4352-LM1]
MAHFDASLRLPTALELPDSDETPVDNELQDSVPAVLKAVLALLWQNRSDWFFGIDMGIYANTEAPRTAIVPDGFLSLGVPRFRPKYGKRGRPSYVLWEEEGIVPVFVLEVVSQTYRGEYTKKLKEYQDLEVLYYAVYDPEGFQPKHERLEVYRLVDGAYVRMVGEPVWLPEIGLGLGRAEAALSGWEREWLFWFNAAGDRYPVPEEYQRYRAEVAECEVQREQQTRLEAEQQARREQQARLEAEKRAQTLAERLRALGIDPDSL